MITISRATQHSRDANSCLDTVGRPSVSSRRRETEVVLPWSRRNVLCVTAPVWWSLVDGVVLAESACNRQGSQGEENRQRRTCHSCSTSLLRPRGANTAFLTPSLRKTNNKKTVHPHKRSPPSAEGTARGLLPALAAAAGHPCDTRWSRENESGVPQDVRHPWPLQQWWQRPPLFDPMGGHHTHPLSALPTSPPPLPTPCAAGHEQRGTSARRPLDGERRAGGRRLGQPHRPSLRVRLPPRRPTTVRCRRGRRRHKRGGCTPTSGGQKSRQPRRRSSR